MKPIDPTPEKNLPSLVSPLAPWLFVALLVLLWLLLIPARIANADPGNVPPTLDPIGDRAVQIGDELTFFLTASDPDAGDSLTFSAVGLPGAAMLNPQTGRVNWRPVPGDEGAYTVTFSVADDGSPVRSDAETIRIFVPGQIVIADGDGQFAVVGNAFPKRLRVQVLDSLQRPMVGVPVTFDIATGTAKFAGEARAMAVTDANGFAEAPALTAGPEPGLVTVFAVIPGNEHVVFGLNALPDLGVAVRGMVVGNPQAGEPVMVNLQAVNADGEPVTDFVGDGVVDVPGVGEVPFDIGPGDGGQTTVQLPPAKTAGANMVNVTTNGNPPIMQSSGFVVTPGPPQRACLLTQATTTTAPGGIVPGPQVAVTDACGNPVANAPVVFAVTNGQFGNILAGAGFVPIGDSIAVLTGPDGLAQSPLARMDGPGEITASPTGTPPAGSGPQLEGSDGVRVEIGIDASRLPAPVIDEVVPTANSLLLFWFNAADYDQIRIHDGNTGALIATVPGTMTSFVLGNLPANVPFAVQLVGVKDGRESIPSAVRETCTLAPPPTPANIIVRRAFRGQIELEIVGFPNVGAGLGGVRIERSYDAAFGMPRDFGYLSITRFYDAVRPDSPVWYRMTFRNCDGIESGSVIVGPIAATAGPAGLVTDLDRKLALAVDQVSEPIGVQVVDGDGKVLAPNPPVNVTFRVAEGVGVVEILGNGSELVVPTDAVGRAEIPGLRGLSPGRFALDARAEVSGHEVVLRFFGEVTGGAIRVVFVAEMPVSVRRGQQLSGLRVRAENLAGIPQPNATIEVLLTGGSAEFAGGGSVVRLVTGADGEADLPTIEAQQVGTAGLIATLFATGSRFALSVAVMTIEITPDVPADIMNSTIEIIMGDDQVVELQPGVDPETGKLKMVAVAGPLEVQVKLNGEPLPGARVDFFGVDVDENGEWVHRVLPPENRKLRRPPNERANDQFYREPWKITRPDGTTIVHRIRHAAMASLPNSRIAVVGGLGGDVDSPPTVQSMYVIHAEDCEIRTVPVRIPGLDARAPRLGHAALHIGNDRVMIVGGVNAFGNPAPTLVVDLRGNSFFEFPGLAISRQNFGAFLWNGRYLLILGGTTIPANPGDVPQLVHELIVVDVQTMAVLATVPLPMNPNGWVRPSLVYDDFTGDVWAVGTRRGANPAELNRVLHIAASDLPAAPTVTQHTYVALDNSPRAATGWGTPDTFFLLTAGNGGVRVIDGRTGRLIQRPQLQSPIASPDPSDVADPNDPTKAYYNAMVEDNEGFSFAPLNAHGIRISDDQQPHERPRLAIVGDDGTMLVYDPFEVTDGEKVNVQFKVVPLASGPKPDGIAVALLLDSPVGEFIALGGANPLGEPTPDLEVFTANRVLFIHDDDPRFDIDVTDGEGKAMSPNVLLPGRVGVHTVVARAYLPLDESANGEVWELWVIFHLYVTCNGNAPDSPEGNPPAKQPAFPLCPDEKFRIDPPVEGPPKKGPPPFDPDFPDTDCVKKDVPVYTPYTFTPTTKLDAAELAISFEGREYNFAEFVASPSLPKPADVDAALAAVLEEYGTRIESIGADELARLVYARMEASISDCWLATIEATVPGGGTYLNVVLDRHEVPPSMSVGVFAESTPSSGPDTATFTFPLIPSDFSGPGVLHVTAGGGLTNPEFVRNFTVTTMFPGPDYTLITESPRKKVELLKVTGKADPCVMVDCLACLEICNVCECPAWVTVVPEMLGNGQIAFLAEGASPFAGGPFLAPMQPTSRFLLPGECKTIYFKGVAPSSVDCDVVFRILVGGKECDKTCTKLLDYTIRVCEPPRDDNFAVQWHQSGMAGIACQEPSELVIELIGPPDCKASFEVWAEQSAGLISLEIPTNCTPRGPEPVIERKVVCVEVGTPMRVEFWGVKPSTRKDDIKIHTKFLGCDCPDAPPVVTPGPKPRNQGGGGTATSSGDPVTGPGAPVITPGGFVPPMDLSPGKCVLPPCEKIEPVTVIALELSVCIPGPKGIFCDDRMRGDRQDDDLGCRDRGLPIHAYYKAPAGCDALLNLSGTDGNFVPFVVEGGGGRFYENIATTSRALGLQRIEATLTIAGKTKRADCEDFTIADLDIKLICEGEGPAGPVRAVDVQNLCAGDDFKILVDSGQGASDQCVILRITTPNGTFESPIAVDTEVALSKVFGAGGAAAIAEGSGAACDHLAEVFIKCQRDMPPCDREEFTMVSFGIEAEPDCDAMFPFHYQVFPPGVTGTIVVEGMRELPGGGMADTPIGGGAVVADGSGNVQSTELTHTAAQWWGNLTLRAFLQLPVRKTGGGTGNQFGCYCTAETMVQLITLIIPPGLKQPIPLVAGQPNIPGIRLEPPPAGVPGQDFGFDFETDPSIQVGYDPATGAIVLLPQDALTEPVTVRIELTLPNGHVCEFEFEVLPQMAQPPNHDPCAEMEQRGQAKSLGRVGKPLLSAPVNSGQPYGNYQHSGDPVQLARGDVFHCVTDMVIAGRGFSFNHVRSYRGQSQRDTAQGRKWDFNYNLRLMVNADGSVTLMEGDKVRAVRYAIDEASVTGTRTFVTPSQYFNRLTFDVTTGIYRLLQPDGMVHLFSDDGRLIMMRDANGNRMDFLYEDTAHPTRNTAVIETMGRRITYSYYPDAAPAGSAGRLAAITDFTGRSVRYTYDAQGRLIQVNWPAIVGTSTGNDWPNGRITRYEYLDDAGNELRNHLLRAIIRPNENEPRPGFGSTSGVPLGTPQVEYVYDADGRCIRQRLGTGDITYEYDTDALPETPQRNATFGKTTVTDRNGNVIVYRFTALGQMVEQAVQTRGIRPGDPAEFVTRWRYNPRNQLLLITYPEGNAIEYVYDDGTVDVAGDIFIDDRLTANVLDIIHHPGPRGASQAELRTQFVIEPIYNQPCVTIDPRGAERGDNLAYTTRSYFDWEEGDNRQRLAEYLVPHLDSTPNTGEGWRYITALMERTKQRAMALGIASTDTVPAANIAVGSDLNGDGETTRIAGNVVRTLHPMIPLTPAQQAAGGFASPVQIITTAAFYNSFGQLTGMIDGEGNVTAMVYFTASAPSGPGSATVVERPNPSFSGGYMAFKIVDVGAVLNFIVVGRRIGGQVVDRFLGLFVPPIPRTSPALPARILTSFQRDLRGNVVAITDARGAIVRHEFNAHDMLVRTTMPAPYSWDVTQIYDANNNLVRSETEHLVPALDADGRPQISLNGPFANLMLETGTAGSFVNRIHYDILDNVVARDIDATYEGTPTRLVTRYSYDANENLTHVIHPEGNSDLTVYDERDLPFRITFGDGSAAASTVSFTYDGNMNQTLVTDARGNSTLAVFDGFDRRIQGIDREANIYFREYDANGNEIATRFVGPMFPGGAAVDLSRTHTDFDALDRLIERRQDLFDETGSPLATGGPAANRPVVRTVIAYDATHRVVGTMADNGGITRTQYDGVTRPIATVDPAGNVRRFFYDGNSNLVRAESTDVATDGLTQSENYATQFSYDVMNRRVRIIDNARNVTDSGYDSRSNLTIVEDALGNTIRHEYDGASRMRETIEDLRDGAGDEAINTRFAYDGNGRLTAYTDDRGNTTTYAYDEQNRVVATRYANAGLVTMAYDANGNRVSRIDPNGVQTLSVFDALDRVIAIDSLTTTVGTERGSTTILPVAQRFAYDGLSRPVAHADLNDPASFADDAVCEISYDSLDRIRRESQRFGGVEFTVESGWESANRRTDIRYPGGNQVATAFDLLDRPTARNWTHAAPHAGAADAQFTYVGLRDLSRRVLGILTRDFRDPFDPTRSSYDAVQRPLFLNYGAGQLAFGFDAVGNETFERDRRILGTGANARNVERYSYDAAYRTTGYVRGVTNSPVQVPFIATLAGDFRRNGQLASMQILAAAPARERTWMLDGVGNWQQFTTNGVVQNADAGAINQYTQFAGHLLDHAPNGLTTRDAPTKATDGFAYEYDGFDRLRRVFDPATNRTLGTYNYDAANRRIFRVADTDGDGAINEAVRYIYDGPQVIEERDAFVGHALLREFVFGNYVDEALWQATGAGAQHLYGHDENFNTYAMLAVTGAVIEFIRYDAYGTYQRYNAAGIELGGPNSPSAIAAFLFQGRRHDAESGLYYFRSRYMNPQTGRFTGFDGMGIIDGANLFAFEGNNPFMRRDPSGTFFFETLEAGWKTLTGDEEGARAAMQRANASWNGFREGMVNFINDAAAFGAGALDSVLMSDLTGWSPGKDLYLAMGGGGKDWCKWYGWGKFTADMAQLAFGVYGIGKAALKLGAKWIAKQAAKRGALSCRAFASAGPRVQKLMRESGRRIMCFAEGTPVWVLKAGLDADAANDALATGTDWRELAEPAPIESIDAGDVVLSRSDAGADAPLSFRAVRAVHLNEREGVIHLTVRDLASGESETITCTPHPFFVLETNGASVSEADVSGFHAGQRVTVRDADGREVRVWRGWVSSADLRAGFVLATPDGRRVVVECVREEQVRRRTYNLTVARDHTFFVGRSGAWVHNTEECTVLVYRWADRTNPASLRSNLSRSPNWRQVSVNDLMNDEGYRLFRADQHAMGEVAHSPFISVAEDIVKASKTPDPWLQRIVSGAPDIGVFEVPRSLIVRPTFALSRRESEILVAADDLAPYLRGWLPNPFLGR